MGDYPVHKVFVDREDAFQYLENEMNKHKGKVVEEIIHIIQAPGTGKTRLLHEFTEKMEREEKAIRLYLYPSDTDNWLKGEMFDIEGKLRRTMLFPLIKEAREFDYISTVDIEMDYQKKYNLDEYEPYRKFVSTIEGKRDFDLLLKFVKEVLPSLNMPLIVVFDEFQTILLMLRNEFFTYNGETLIPKFIDLLGELIKYLDVFVVVAGTGYKAIRYVEREGSPLKGKTKGYILEPLKLDYVREYYKGVFGEPKDEVEQHLCDWMVKKSNGVARTMVWMAEELDWKGLDWVKETSKECGIERAIRELDEKVYRRVGESVRYTIRHFYEYEKGIEVLKWLANRPDDQLYIPAEELEGMIPKYSDEKVCSIEDLVNQGIINFLNDGYRILNIFFKNALKEYLERYGLA